jgi:hypothetical protein
MTAQGWKGYASNTMVFGPGEGFRMMMCFGTKDFLMPKIGGKANAQTVHAGIGIPLHTAQMALIAGPLVAAVETTSAVVTETVSTIQVRLTRERERERERVSPTSLRVTTGLHPDAARRLLASFRVATERRGN